jgi:ubiquinone/menaquinone biosynthesis C-methylase UbiE
MTSVREVWAAGDYPAVAQYITGAADACVRAAAVQPGEHVLDVACGNGNTAIAAAAAGAIATGVDITPELLDAARALAPDVEWIEGDAQALPFADDSFDVVLSTFGCMFAPDHRRAADELRRVAKPGGRIAIASWTPEGKIGGFFRTIATHAPPPPGDSPLLWGTEAHVRELFGDVTTERRAIPFAFESAAGAADFYATNFGPLVMARAAAEDEAALLADLRSLFESFGTAYEGEYLMAVART